MSMRLLAWLLLVLPGPAWAVTYVLAWEYTGQATSFAVEQCTNTAQGCPMVRSSTVAGTVRRVTLQGLAGRTAYCWRVQVTNTGQYSNVVCSP